jgi:plasmid stability protein
MSTTLTIRNLAEPVKQKLRMQAASHGRSMEAEAREILTMAVNKSDNENSPASAKGKFDHLVGIWKGRMTTDEIMEITRGE